jgi:hypothetical protein
MQKAVTLSKCAVVRTILAEQQIRSALAVNPTFLRIGETPVKYRKWMLVIDLTIYIKMPIYFCLV